MPFRSFLLFWMAAGLCFLSPAQDQPQPTVVTPGQNPGDPPSDAIVLFNGTDSSEWVHSDGSPATWPVTDGAIVSTPGTGDIFSKHKISSAQIHVEFRIPFMPEAMGQDRGNSGVFLQARYEIQVLDSYQNPTYPTGSCAAVYSQYAPLVNASRPPEEWQTYDIVFHAAQCGPDGALIAPPALTLLHNGVLVQDGVAIQGPTSGPADINPCEPAPVRLQDHLSPVRFRNIWYRPLSPDPDTQESLAQRHAVNQRLQ